MNNAKVTVTKEVAEAIEDVRKVRYTNSKIIADIENDRGCTAYGTLMPTLIKFSRKSEGNIDVLMKALVNGYTVEKSPEEKVREYYDGLVDTATDGRNDAETRELARYEASGVRQTLDFLGIKIEGVNA